MLMLAVPSAAQTTARPRPLRPPRRPPRPRPALPPRRPRRSITVFARTQEKTKDRIFLTGNVEIRYKELRLFADRVEIDPKTKDCVATGKVTIQLPDESVTAEEVFINLETKEGKLVQADGMVQPTIFYHAASIDKKTGNLYELIGARITSCAQPVPRWRFDASRANFRKDDYVEMWNAVFHIKKIPVFYMPYMRYPVGRDRSTGFLIPRIGWSGQKGFNYEQSFYWAIARNMDATVNLDYYAARGVGGGLNFRYLFRGGTGGEASLYGFTFKRDATGAKQDDAYILRLNHNQPLPLGFSLVADVDIQSSYDFLREFDNNFRRAIVSNRSSQVYLQRSWSYFSLSARVSKFETYFSQLNQMIISKNTPQVSFNMFKVKLFGPLYASFASGYIRQEYGFRQDYLKGKQKKTGSLSFAPTLVGAVHGDPLADGEHGGHGEFRLLPADLHAGEDDGRRRAAVHEKRLAHGRGHRPGVLEGLSERPRGSGLQAQHRAVRELPARQPASPSRSASSRTTGISSAITRSSTGSRTGSTSRTPTASRGSSSRRGSARRSTSRPRRGR